MNEDAGNRQNRQDEGLKFFGKVTASISHEVKNVLAIVNENAGLMEDLVLLYEKKGTLDIERLKNLAGRVRDQVKRGDGIIKNMNRFAHSIDNLTEQADLNELLELVAGLIQRLAFMKGVSVESKAGTERIMITTNTFVLENLIWKCFDFGLNFEPCPDKIILYPQVTENGVRIRFSGISGLTEQGIAGFRERVKDGFLDILDGFLSVDRESSDLMLDLPRDISTGWRSGGNF